MSALWVDVDIAGEACDTRIPRTHRSCRTEIIAHSAFSKATFELELVFTRKWLGRPRLNGSVLPRSTWTKERKRPSLRTTFYIQSHASYDGFELLRLSGAEIHARELLGKQ